MTEYPISDNKKLCLPSQLNSNNNNRNISNSQYHKIITNNIDHSGRNDEESVNYNNSSRRQPLTTSPTTYVGNLCYYGNFLQPSLGTRTEKASKTPGSRLYNSCKQQFHYFNEDYKDILPSEKTFLLYSEQNFKNNNNYDDNDDDKIFDFNADSNCGDYERSTRTANPNITIEELTGEYLRKNVELILKNLQHYTSEQQTNRRNQQQQAFLRNNIRKSLLNCHNNSNNINSVSTKFYHYLKDHKKVMANIISSPESDYNSNPPHYSCGGTGGEFNLNGIPNSTLGGFVGNLNNLSGINTMGLPTGCNLNCSIASSHDFTHDNSDYQWFLDYGYRDGVIHQSILSSLSASYNGIGELSYYEDLAKNIDANLAEVDMESFRTEDIHSLLTHLPSFCSKGNGSTTIRKNEQQIDDLLRSDTIDNSICKSKLLFSPIKESHISIDSLDLDVYPEDSDIILTCQANKDNYTIAFEGSGVYSDESYYAEPSDPTIKTSSNYINLYNNIDIVKRKSLEVSMSRSDHSFTTWSKLKKNSTSQLQRYPSGNNNTSVNMITCHTPYCIIRKSSSLPNLHVKKNNSHLLNVSEAVSNSTVESYKSRNLLPMCYIQLSSSGSESPVHRCNNNNNSSNMHSTESAATMSSSNKQNHYNQCPNNQQPAFNLVKLFIKQKSNSSDTCMDVSSGCWPSDTSSSLEQNHQQHKRIHKKSMNDSGKGSALSRHEEVEIHTLDNEADKTTNIQCRIDNDNYSDEDGNNIRNDDDVDTSSYQLDSLDICENKEKIIFNVDKNTISQKDAINSENLYREVFESFPIRREFLKESDINTNTSQQHYQNPQIYHLRMQNNNNLNNINTNNNFNNISNTNNNNKLFENELISDGKMNKSASDNENTFGTIDTSRTSENLTQIFNVSSNKQLKAISITSCPVSNILSKENKLKISPAAEMASRSIQTSLLLKDRLRFVPPSFLANLNKLGSDQRAPVYVIYPNYTLPDLGFVKDNNASSDIILSPFNYRSDILHGDLPRPSLAQLSLKNLEGKGENLLRNIKYTQVTDWKSLVTLLPIEYRKKLKHIPEADTELDPECAQRPLFCMTPPIRRNMKISLCDCAKYFQEQTNYDLCQEQNDQSQQQQTVCFSSSGSSQPPSSGYRGSSTLLTESEICTMQQQQQCLSRDDVDPTKNMYVYKYENNRMENNNIISHDRLPPLTGGTVRTPKSILRRTISRGVGGNIKRNSMFENENSTESNVKNLEKRRSLQEPYKDLTYTDNDYDNDNLLTFEDSKLRQYYENLGDRNVNTKNRCFEQVCNKKTSDEIVMQQINLIEKKIHKEQDLEARLRAETFLSSVPKSELKYYAEIANILESTEVDLVQYDAIKLKNEVSRALSQKKVSFNQPSILGNNINFEANYLMPLDGNDLHLQQQINKFSTPPNSPNISVAALRLHNNTKSNQHHHHHHHQHQHQYTVVNNHNNLNNPRLSEKKDILTLEKERLERISSNRFKRLQIQWELLSKDSSVMLKDLAREMETKSGGSTPTSTSAQQRSRIPRPVSYPTSKKSVKSKTSSDPRSTTTTVMDTKSARSPSRIIPPKKYTSSTLIGTGCTTGGNIANAGQTAAGSTVPNQSLTSRPRTFGKMNATLKKRIPFSRSNAITRAQ